MKIRNMWTNNTDNIGQSEKLMDKHSETMQDGYTYRLSEIISNYSDEDIVNMERASKLAYESVENKLFYDEMNPADVERVQKLKKDKADAETRAKENQAKLDKLLDDYVSGRLQKVEPQPPTA